MSIFQDLICWGFNQQANSLQELTHEKNDGTVDTMFSCRFSLKPHQWSYYIPIVSQLYPNYIPLNQLNPLNPTESHNIPLYLIAHLLYPHDIPPLHQLHLGSPGPGEALCISGSSRALPPAWSIEPHLWKNDGKMTMQHGIPWQPGSGYSIFKPRIWVEHGWAA